MTESATRFVGADTFAAAHWPPRAHLALGAPGEVLHVRLAHETDLVVVAPATANLLAKLAHGLADDLLTVDAAGIRRARSSSLRRCTPACGSTRRPGRTSRRSPAGRPVRRAR